MPHPEVQYPQKEWVHQERDFKVPPPVLDLSSKVYDESWQCWTSHTHNGVPGCRYESPNTQHQGIECPFKTRIEPSWVETYRIHHVSQYPSQHQPRELFRLILADINPRVKLVDHKSKKPTFCDWSQTRAFHGTEGRRQKVERWEFVFTTYEQWLEFQKQIVTHRLIKTSDRETYFEMHLKRFTEGYSNLRSEGRLLSCDLQVQVWSENFDREFLSMAFEDLSGSLPKCAAEYPRLEFLADFRPEPNVGETLNDQTSPPQNNGRRGRIESPESDLVMLAPAG